MTEVRIQGLKAVRQNLQKKRLGPLTKTLHRRLEVIWRNAADAFLREVIRKTLIETGMSLASFLPLSRAIRRANTTRIIQARTSGRPNLEGIPEFPSGERVPGKKGVSAGIRKGRDAFIFNTGSPTRPVFRFQFSTLVFQFAFHEPSQGALDAGFAAFTEVIEKDFPLVMFGTLVEFLTPKPRVKSFLRNLES